MPKKIVLFSDGTGNSSAKSQKTNVWRLYQALDQTSSDQIAFYDDGVGTSSNKYLAKLGGAFGWGLKRNVLDLYKFVCRNYQPRDEIYGFGFSRGAFTIRTLVGLIANEGLVVARSEEELSRNAAAAYRHYRSQCFPSWSPIVWGLRRLRDLLLWAKDRLKGYQTYDELAAATAKAGRRDIRIRFLGLWDTVEAYGIPILELKRGIDWVLWPMRFGNLKLSPLVDRACHALSLDDERTTFHPLVWDEAAEAESVEAKMVRPGRITQVWFVGAHSNVGGGYPDDQLSLMSLEWVMSEAMVNGLALDPVAVKQVSAAKSPFGRLYNSRSGFAAYYRYSPRRVPIPVHNGTEIRPIIHGGVVMRMASGSDTYAPISLPRKFWVLGVDGKLVPMEGFDDRLKMDVTKQRAASAAIAGDQVSSGRKKGADLRAIIKKFKPPAQDVVSLVWDTVWWRRVVYFITVLLTTSLVLYPWLQGFYAGAARWLIGTIPFAGKSLSKDYENLLEKINTGSRGFVSDVVDALSGFLPGFAQPWADALREHPVEFASIVLAILLSLYTSSWLETRIRNRARLAWHDEHREDYLRWLRGNQSGWRKGMLAGGLVVSCFLGLAVWQRRALSTQIELALATGIIALLLLWRFAEMAKFGKPGMQGETLSIPHTFGLSLARTLRKNRVLVTLYRWIFQRAVPISFAVCVIVAGALLANRILFDAFSAAGAYCTSSEGLREQASGLSAVAHEDFKTDEICWRTGIPLQKGQRYRITLTIDADWFDRTIRTDAEGNLSHSVLHYLGIPLKRWWGRNWFQPVARIGELGNDEYVLESIDPLQPHVYCTDPAGHGGQSATASPEVMIGEGGTHLNGEDCSKLKDTDLQQTCACKQCKKQQPQTKRPGAISSQITDASAAELARCSPTPDKRRTLNANIEAKTSGELFIYVNDSVLMLPGMSNLFYRNNSGTAKVRIEPVSTLNGRRVGDLSASLHRARHHQAGPPARLRGPR